MCCFPFSVTAHCQLFRSCSKKGISIIIGEYYLTKLIHMVLNLSSEKNHKTIILRKEVSLFMYSLDSKSAACYSQLKEYIH